jgi:peroxiredoxin
MALESVDERAPDVTLQGPSDEEVALADAWREGSAVLLFLRHFG